MMRLFWPLGVVVLCLFGALAPPASTIPDSLQNAVYHARDKVLPALVHIQPISEVFVQGERKKETSVGSGVLIDNLGHVVTNYHVAGKAEKLICTLESKERISAELVGGDPYTDIAVIRLRLEEAETHLVPADLGDSASLQVGQYVLAMGSPLALSRTVSCGVVSCVDRAFGEVDTLPTGEETGMFNTWIQTDAAINPGNSGGPLVNLSGEVVGINSRAMMWADNLGFAIPINVVKRVAGEIIATGRVSRSWIGVTLQPLQELGEHFGVDEREGVLVAGIDPGSPAQAAGLASGDVMTSFDGWPTTARFTEEIPAIAGRIASTSVDKEVALRFMRAGQPRSVTLTTDKLGKAQVDEFAADYWGFAVKDISRQMALEMKRENDHGVLVTGVQPGRRIKSGQLLRGDVVQEVDRRPVANLDDFKKLYEQLSGEKQEKVFLKTDRRNATRLVPVTPDYSGSAEPVASEEQEEKP